MLKNLIKEVLEEQQLDEKNLNLKPLKNKNAYTKSPSKWNNQGWEGDDIKANLSDEAFPFGGGIDQIASLDADPNTLSPDETATAVADPNLQGIADELVSYSAADFHDDHIAAVKAGPNLQGKPGPNPPSAHKFSSASTSRGLGSSSSITAYANVIKKEIGNLTKNNAANLQIEIRDLLADMFTIYKKPPNPNSLYQKETDALVAKLKALSGSNPPPPVKQAAIGLLKFINSGIEVGDRRYDQLYANPEFQSANTSQAERDVDGEETDTILAGKTFMSAVDSSASAVGGLFGGAVGTEANLKNRIANLQSTVEQFKNLSTVPGSNLAGLNLAQSMAFIAKMSFISQLFVAGKNAEGRQAGFDFERFCGLIFGGVIAGKSNKAVDVITGAKNGYLRLSQKFVGEPTQITQNANNSNNVLFGNGVPIYYMALIKADRAASATATFSSLDMYVLKVTATGASPNSGTIEVEYLDSNGTFQTGHSFNSSPSGTYSYAPAGSNVLPIELDFNFGVIGDDPQAAIAEFEKQLSQSGGLVEQIHTASKNIYQLSTNMLRNTEEYRAVKGGTKTSLKSNPQEYVDQVSLDYGELYKEYQKLFVTAGGDKPTKGKLKEGRVITSKMLKKLFKETLKK